MCFLSLLSLFSLSFSLYILFIFLLIFHFIFWQGLSQTKNNYLRKFSRSEPLKLMPLRISTLTYLIFGLLPSLVITLKSPRTRVERPLLRLLKSQVLKPWESLERIPPIRPLITSRAALFVSWLQGKYQEPMIYRSKKQILAMLSTQGKEYIDQVIIAQLNKYLDRQNQK